jgi:3-methyl-2-oxobutanoate hydroxymethyltransferase
MYTQLEQRGMAEPPVNVGTLSKMKQDGVPIACLTAYDASYAALVDTAGTDLVLVGDSLGMVIQGHDTNDSPLAATQAYVAAVKNREYPAPEHCFS